MPAEPPRRDEPELPSTAIVVRGGMMFRETVEQALAVTVQRFDLYLLSVVAHPTLTAREVWERAPSKHTKVRVSTAGQLRECGFELIPTFDAPHYSILLPGPLNLDMWTALDDAFSPPTKDP
jgi:hypothetical protein